MLLLIEVTLGDKILRAHFFGRFAVRPKLLKSLNVFLSSLYTCHIDFSDFFKRTSENTDFSGISFDRKSMRSLNNSGSGCLERFGRGDDLKPADFGFIYELLDPGMKFENFLTCFYWFSKLILFNFVGSMRKSSKPGASRYFPKTRNDLIFSV